MDLQSLRNPVSPSAPCGIDLENNNDPRWGQLNTLAAGEKRDGITQPPRWQDVRDLALELAQETRHLRLGVILTECASFVDGIGGFSDGLSLLRFWCENFWEDVYPAGELEDKRDFRPPVIEALNYPSFLVRLKAVPVSQSAGGRYSLADLEDAEGVDKSDPDAVNRAQLVQGGFRNTSADVLGKALQAIQDALEHARAIEGIFDDKFGSGYGVNLSDLRDLLSRMAKRLSPYCAQETAAGADGGSYGEESTASGGGGVAVAAPGAINSRESAIRALDKVIAWFEANEPANPVPFLLKRAQRCAGMNFFELISDFGMDTSPAQTILSPQSSGS